MTNISSHPAVWAGLLGGATWGVPTWAYAISLDQMANLASDSLVVQFLLGCMTGAALAGATVGAASLVKRHHDQGKEADATHHDAPAATSGPIVLNAEESPWSSSSLSLVRAQLQAEEDDPTGSLKRLRTGQITLDLADREHELSQASAQTDAPRRARHAAVDPSAAETQVIRRQSGRHFAKHAAVGAREAVVAERSPLADLFDERPAGKHAAPKPEAPKPTAAPVAVAPLPVVSTPALGAAARASLANLPTIDSRRMMLEAATTNVLPRSRDEHIPVVGEAEAPMRVISPNDPFMAAAVDNRQTLRKRLSMRAKNVRDVLSERLSPEAMGTIPQIRRGDGSVDEIAPTWFDQNVVPAIASLAAKIDDLDELDSTAPHDAETFESKVRVSTAPTVLLSSEDARELSNSSLSPADATLLMPQATAEMRASYISNRIAEVDLGMFPERRAAEDLEHEDVWEVALAAMGETIRQQEPVFEDMVGGPSTIDDPEGLEGPTTLIPFRKRSRRPSAVDTAAYVDYLIDDEVSRGRREAARARRHPKHAYLRVIEGGTSPLLLRQRAEGSGYIAQPRGRHFATTRYAAEA